MEFKEGDKVIYEGWDCTIIKVLPNTNRYTIVTPYSDKKGYRVDEKEVHINLTEYHKYVIEKSKIAIEKCRRRFEHSKQILDKKIAESEKFLLEEKK